MSSDRFYPPIDEGSLSSLALVKRLYEADPEYFSDPDCPYPDSLIGVFTGSVAPPLGAGEDAGASLNDEEIDVQGEITRLLKEIKDFGAGLDVDDTAERATYFRTSTALIERLLAARDKADTQAQAKDFMRIVLQIMQDELPVDIRQAVIARLRSI